MTSTERYVVAPRAPFLAATVAMALVVVAMIALSVLVGGLGSWLCLAVAAAATVAVVGRLRAKVTVTPEQIEVRNGYSSTVVPRRPAPEVVVIKQALGWLPVLRVTGGADVLLLPLAAWSQTGAAKAAAELSAALDRVRRR